MHQNFQESKDRQDKLLKEELERKKKKEESQKVSYLCYPKNRLENHFSWLSIFFKKDQDSIFDFIRVIPGIRSLEKGEDGVFREGEASAERKGTTETRSESEGDRDEAN